MNEGEGLIHIYCGDGKGKTTAAIGLSIRAAGSGMKVVIVQFLKQRQTSEMNIIEKIPNITILRGKEGQGFLFSMTDEQKHMTKEIHNINLNTAIEMARNGECDLLVLDEIIATYNHNLIDRELLLSFIDTKPKKLELVMTGRKPEKCLVDRADYVSEIKKIKHPFDMGIGARIGIEQ